ncbi:DUF2934 domain-containing protein [Rhizobium sp. TH2]|uniref:DUF2934 domain-containing protein n=1 Tax=Rhizobium sp. TH2 TaxID=2775403 RepID=UPI00215889D8|nr:DUF2934 domain-containing protein [Rhizobium sp. TH2]
MDDSEEAVRLRAYQIWERDGRPDGEHESHWQKALEELIRPAGRPVETTVVTTGPQSLAQPNSSVNKRNVEKRNRG